MPSLSCILVSTSQTVDNGYDAYFIDTSNNSVTLTMPPISGDGDHFWFRSIDMVDPSPNVATLLPDGSDTIENASSFPLAWGTGVHLCSLGTTWYRISDCQ